MDSHKKCLPNFYKIYNKVISTWLSIKFKSVYQLLFTYTFPIEMEDLIYNSSI